MAAREFVQKLLALKIEGRGPQPRKEHPLAAGKGKETDWLFEPPENNGDFLTPRF